MPRLVALTRSPACRKAAPTSFHEWVVILERRHEAEAIAVAAFERAVQPNRDSVYRANPPRQRLDAVDHRERRLLVRNRQIASAKAKDRQRTKRLLDMLRPHRQWEISAINAGLVEPEAVKHRRSGMGHRPSHDAGQARRPADRHAVVENKDC